ncbi:AEC family transporter [Leuconostoc mesenteroides]|uniref:AEC family transporter n=1 Tax=Leuconostoc mesenteroides TaxID=1245 RepID=UPI002079047C|nr:AEC family transporter [Leuconostoc mesenteroides]USI45846.1 AEC family transporter [Leuconostoc mesenteroides]
MSVFLQSIQGVLVILVMVAIGYGLASAKWFTDKSGQIIARIVTQVALPMYMVNTITHDFTKGELIRLLPEIKFPIISMLVLFAISVGSARALGIRKNRRGLFQSMFFNSNTVFVGLPINMALFGVKSLPYVLVYYMVNTTFFWTLGTYLIQRDGEGAWKFDIRATLSKVFSPPLLGFILGIIFVWTDVKLPTFVVSDLQYIGNLTVPLSMFFIGIAVQRAGLRNMEFNKYSLGILFGRFILAPIVMFFLLWKADVPHLMKQVFILQSAMPVMTNAPVVASLYGADADYAAIMVTESTILSLVVVPILMTLINN